jgi:8-amino-7-oxononanoate synthase
MTLPVDRFTAFRVGLQARSESARLRRIQRYVPEPGTPYLVHEGERLLGFCSNDYRGLATDSRVTAAAARVAESHGAGARASRLVVGAYDIHADLEAELAAFTGREAALLVCSGFQANSTVIPALAPRDGLVVCDEAAHASIRMGCRQSRATWQRFRHNDAGHLDALLAGRSHDAGSPLVVTESLFSMDGDRAPLADLCEVAERHGALLMVDDAHAMGVLGERGEGLAAAHERVDMVLGTFGKAFGSAGAFVAGRELVRSWLENSCTGLVYSTAPAPPTVAAARAALDVIRSETPDLARFRIFVAATHARLREAGFDTSPSDTHIIPIHLGDDRAALDCEAYLRSRGILAVAIRAPTVPGGTARLRISLTTLHTQDQVHALVEALVTYRGREAA